MLTLNRIGLGLAIHFINGNPLVPDYVKQNSRGRAAVLQIYGMLFGEFLAVTICMRFFADMDPAIGFYVVGGIVGVLCILVFAWVREPAIKLERPKSVS